MGSYDSAVMTGFICRLCSELHKNVIHIFSDKGAEMELEKLIMYIPIQVSRLENLPQTVCHSCISKLNMQYKLVEKIRKARKIFVEQGALRERGENEGPVMIDIGDQQESSSQQVETPEQTEDSQRTENSQRTEDSQRTEESQRTDPQPEESSPDDSPQEARATEVIHTPTERVLPTVHVLETDIAHRISNADRVTRAYEIQIDSELPDRRRGYRYLAIVSDNLSYNDDSDLSPTE